MTAIRLSPLPLGLILLFFILSFTQRVQQNETLITTFWGLSAVLLMMYLFMLMIVLKRQYAPEIKIIIVKAHYVQLTMHLLIFAYWGWYWDQVYAQAILILAQLIFVHSFDLMFRWMRGETWILGFGRFPIIFSTNLFLWFRDDWFYLQFAMITFGILAKDFFTWERDGRRTHIFNPSAISLSVASLLLIMTESTNISWANEIANTLSYPTYIYAWIFFLGLIVQSLFHVTLVTLSTGVTLMVLGALYYQFSGVYFFFTSDIPIAVFLGLHLLVTDPVTSPKNNFAKIIFGFLYAISVMLLFEILEAFGTPTFYDKLLAIPLLNLSVQLLDRFGKKFDFSSLVQFIFRKNLTAPQLNLVAIALWITVFISWYMSGHIGQTHPGRQSTFWEQACDQEQRRGCQNLYDLISTECDKDNALACAKLGSMYRRGRGIERDDNKAFELVSHACDLGFNEACDHLYEYRPDDLEEEESLLKNLRLFPQRR